MTDQLFSFQLDFCNSHGNDVSSPPGDSESGSSDSGNSVEESSGMGVNDCKPSKSAMFVSNIVTLRSMAKAGRNFTSRLRVMRDLPRVLPLGN